MGQLDCIARSSSGCLRGSIAFGPMVLHVGDLINDFLRLQVADMVGTEANFAPAARKDTWVSFCVARDGGRKVLQFNEIRHKTEVE